MNRGLHIHPIVGVMGSHEKPWEELARPVGELLAAKGFHLLTGAGGGVMTAVARAFTAQRDRAGLSIGIIPTIEKEGRFLRTDEYPNPHIEIPIVTPLDNKALSDSVPYSRNYVNIMTSHAVVILPGDHGTRNEASLSLMMKKPHILFGPEQAFKLFPQGSRRVDTIKEVEEFLDKDMGDLDFISAGHG